MEFNCLAMLLLGIRELGIIYEIDKYLGEMLFYVLKFIIFLKEKFFSYI